MSKKITLAALAALFALPLAACGNDEPDDLEDAVDEVGDEMEDAAEDTADDLEDATDPDGR
jgi:predicted small lipoprotein YifL